MSDLGSAGAVAWWKALSDQQACYVAAKAVMDRGGDPGDMLYAVAKPWKWIQEAYEDHIAGQQLDFADTLRQSVRLIEGPRATTAKNNSKKQKQLEK